VIVESGCRRLPSDLSVVVSVLRPYRSRGIEKQVKNRQASAEKKLDILNEKSTGIRRFVEQLQMGCHRVKVTYRRLP